MLVAGLGTSAVVSLGSALQILVFVLAACSALAAGSSILVVQAVGARDIARVSHLARQSLLLSILVSLPLAGTGLALAGPIIGIIGLSQEVAHVATGYLQVTMGSVVIMVTSLIAGGVLRSAGDSRTPMVVSAIARSKQVRAAAALRRSEKYASMTWPC